MPPPDLSLHAPFRFASPQLAQIAMPVGGLGAGNVCLNGHGGLQDFSIRHRPHTTALPDANEPADAAFALLRIAGYAQKIGAAVIPPIIVIGLGLLLWEFLCNKPGASLPPPSRCQSRAETSLAQV